MIYFDVGSLKTLMQFNQEGIYFAITHSYVMCIKVL